MPAAEQRARMQPARAVREFNVFRWAGRMLPDAARQRSRDRLNDRLAESQTRAFAGRCFRENEGDTRRRGG